MLGRVPRYEILSRSSWQFFTGLDTSGKPLWAYEEAAAQSVFWYQHMTGENHVSYNPGIQRYLMGNYAFLDEVGQPRPYYTLGIGLERVMRSQLTLLEASEPWGPWSLFYQNDNWGTYGDYQPSFPTKWMSPDGRTMLIVSSGSFDDYNLVLQKVGLQISSI